MNSFVRSTVAALVPVLMGHFSAAAAATFEMKMFGHHIVVLERDFKQVLSIDGREVLKDAILHIEDIHLISGTPAIVGSSSVGGNACDAAPFIVSFPRRATLREWAAKW